MPSQRVASVQAACDRAALLAALASGDARFYLGEEPGQAPQMSGDETLLADSVAAGIDRLDAAAVRVRLQHDAGDAPAARPLRVAISAALPGGATLVGVMWPVVRGGAWHWFAHGGLGNDVRWQQTTALPYRCRPLTLQRALRNLIDNAVRYGHRAWLSARQAGDRLLLIVDDDGPGIAEESLHRVFQPFAQIGRSHEAGGVGLGLAIARSYVEAHGGRVVLENRPSGGLRATIQLPVQPSPSLPVWQPAAAAIGV